MDDENPSLTISFDDSNVKISFEFDDNFPIAPVAFVKAVGQLLLNELS